MTLWEPARSVAVLPAVAKEPDGAEQVVRMAVEYEYARSSHLFQRIIVSSECGDLRHESRTGSDAIFVPFAVRSSRSPRTPPTRRWQRRVAVGLLLEAIEDLSFWPRHGEGVMRLEATRPDGRNLTDGLPFSDPAQNVPSGRVGPGEAVLRVQVCHKPP
jgi:hypothetical protein